MKYKALLCQLSYTNMRLLLEAKHVITENEKKQIDVKAANADQMASVIDIICGSLIIKNSKKYKGFLEAMEQSDDESLKEMARKLGE